jgi:hypothetical protein
MVQCEGNRSALFGRVNDHVVRAENLYFWPAEVPEGGGAG